MNCIFKNLNQMWGLDEMLLQSQMEASVILSYIFPVNEIQVMLREDLVLECPRVLMLRPTEPSFGPIRSLLGHTAQWPLIVLDSH